jgi:hypothetical protein
MKNTLRNFLKAAFWYLMFDGLILGYVGLIPGAQLAAAQTYLSNTTLSSAVSTTATTTVKVASATGITATNTMLFVDNEGMFVNSVSGTTLSVTRGYYGGRSTTHVSGALVWFGPPPAFGWAEPAGFPSGSCTRSNQLYLPYINTDSGAISDCVGGVWVTGGNATGNYGSFFRVPLPNTGGIAYASVTTDTVVAAATSMYCTELDMQASKYTTGLGILNGATVGTDKHIVILYDGTGNLLANSAVAGATTSGANTYQTYAFTTPYFVVGPAKYYACVQSNGTPTDSLRMIPTGNQDTYTTKAVTGQTFGTIAATFTVPTTFTTVVGPRWELY